MLALAQERDAGLREEFLMRRNAEQPRCGDGQPGAIQLVEGLNMAVDAGSLNSVACQVIDWRRHRKRTNSGLQQFPHRCAEENRRAQLRCIGLELIGQGHDVAWCGRRTSIWAGNVALEVRERNVG